MLGAPHHWRALVPARARRPTHERFGSENARAASLAGQYLHSLPCVRLQPHGSHADASGAITMPVMDSGLQQDNWRLEMSAYGDGEHYPFRCHTASSVLHVQGPDISGCTPLSGANGPFFAATPHTQASPGVQLHSKGHHHFPAGVRPPTPIQADPIPGVALGSLAGLGFRTGDAAIQRCLGAASSALGSCMGAGAAWRAGLTGLSGGTMGSIQRRPA